MADTGIPSGTWLRKVNLRCAKLVGLRHGTEDRASQVFASGRVTIIRASQLPNKLANHIRGRRICVLTGGIYCRQRHLAIAFSVRELIADNQGTG